MTRLLLVLFVLAILCAPALATSGQTIIYAIGDNMFIVGNDAPIQIVIPNARNMDAATLSLLTAKANNASYSGTLWVFTDNKVWTYPFITNGSAYNITVPAEVISDMHFKRYTYSLQFSGSDQRMDIVYDSDLKEIGSNIRSISNTSILGLSGDLIYEKFQQYRTDNYIQDVYLDGIIDSQYPSIQVTDEYDKGNGDLYIGGTTNLAPGDLLVGIVNGNGSSGFDYYIKDMVRTSIASGDNSSQLRKWAFVFPQELSGLLPKGTNFVYINYGGVETTVPFDVADISVVPTPTPTPKPIYSVTGNLIGIVNSVAPDVTPTPVVVTQTPEINFTETPLGNRSVGQRETVYVGERNINIMRAIGWLDQKTAQYYLNYCGGPDLYTVVVNNPNSYYFDPKIFANRTGLWCQYTPDYTDKDPIVAIIVKQAPVIKSNLTTASATSINIMSDNVSVTQLNGSAVSTTIAIPTPVLPPTPSPTPTSEYPEGTVDLTKSPLDPKLGILAIGIVILLLRYKRR